MYGGISIQHNRTFGAVRFSQSDRYQLFWRGDGQANVNITGGTAPYTQEWGGANPEAFASEGVYSAIITDSLGCTDSISVEIREPAPFSIDLGSDTTICPKDSFFTETQQSDIVRWLWSTGDTVSFTNSIDSGLVWLMATDTNLCVASDTMFLSYFSEPEFQFSIP